MQGVEEATGLYVRFMGKRCVIERVEAGFTGRSWWLMLCEMSDISAEFFQGELYAL